MNGNSTNAANTIVSRDGTGSFAAADITVDNLIISGVGQVDGRDVSVDGSNQDILQILTGYSAGSPNMGIAGGSIISNNATFQQAFGELETAISAIPGTGTLNAGFVPFYDGANFQDSPLALSGSDFGIGTLAPATKFHLFEGADNPIIQTLGVTGTTSNQQAGLAFMSQAGNNETYSQVGTKGWLVTARGNAFTDVSQQNDLMFSYSEGSGDFNLLKLDHAGFVGINTNDPVSDLQIRNTGHLFMDGTDMVLSANIHFAASNPTFTENGNALALGISPAGGLDVLYAGGGTAGSIAPLAPIFSVNTSGVASVSNELNVANNIIAGGNVNVGSDLIFTDNAANKQIVVPNNNGGSDGFDLALIGSNGDVGFDGGNIVLSPGTGNNNGVIIADGDMVFSDGGDKVITIFEEATGTVRGDNLLISAGNANVGGGQDGGNLDLAPGLGDGAGNDGFVRVQGNMAIIHDGTFPRTLDFDGGVSGGNVISVRAPESTFAGYQMVLPPGQGGPGQVLTNIDGAGALDWTTPTGLTLPFSGSDMTDGTTFAVENTFVDRLTAEFFGNSPSNATAAVVIHNRDEVNGSGGVLSLGVTDNGGSTADGVFLVAERSAPGPSLASDFVVRTLDGTGSLVEGIRVAANSDVTFQNGNVNIINDAFITGLLNADGGATLNGNVNVSSGDLVVSVGNIGMNTATPRGTMDLNGSMYVRVKELTAPGTVDGTDYHIFFSGAGGFTQTLPVPDANPGRKLEFSSNADGIITLDAGGGNQILNRGVQTQTLILNKVDPNEFQSVVLVQVNANSWMVVNSTNGGV